jgi:acyl carrier protein
MSNTTGAERELTELLIEALGLEELQASDVDPEAPLFGYEQSGWGLDSIDALEIALAIQQRYGVELRSEDEGTKAAFASLRSLALHVAERQLAVQS